MNLLSPASSHSPEQRHQGRKGRKWNLRTHPNAFSHEASNFSMELQRNVQTHQVDICMPDMPDSIQNYRRKPPAQRLNKWDYTRKSSLKTRDSASPSHSFSWEFNGNSSSIINGELSGHSDDALELANKKYHPTFRIAPFHGATGIVSLSESLQEDDMESSQLINTTKETEEHQDATDDQLTEHTAAPPLRYDENDGAGCCNGLCAEKMKGWAGEIWARETAFQLKEEAEAAKKKSTDKPEARLRSAKKASHVILAAQAKGSRDSLALCPLRFTDNSMEKEFAFNQERSASYRNTMAGVSAFFLILIHVLISAFAYKTKVYLHDFALFTSSVTFFVSCNILAVSYALSYRIPFVNQYLEYTSYFIITMTILLHSSLVIWWKSVIYSASHFEKYHPVLSELFGLSTDCTKQKEDSVIYNVVVVYNEILMGMMLEGTLFLCFVLIDILTPTRFFIASWLQIGCTIVGIGPFIYGAALLQESILSNTARIVALISISFAGLTGKYPVELCRRGLFFEWLSLKRNVAKLLETRKKAMKMAGSSSALDDIRSNCNQIGGILANLKKGSGNFDVAAGLANALTLIQECLFVFATCKNLYLTNVNEDLKDENFIKAFDLGNAEEANLLNAESALSSNPGRPLRLELSGDRLAPGLYRDVEAEHSALLLPVIGLDLSFDPLEFERSYGDGNSSVLLDAGTALLSRVAADWGCDDTVLRNFLIRIDGLYQKQPYHNSKHGTLVAHTMCLLCRTLGIFREMNALGIGSCVVASLCHDVGHPGRNNNFFVSEMSPLSIVFNDSSVLENFHCSLTFRVLEDECCNVFAFLSDAEIREVRSKIIELILATDMRTHFEFLNRFRTIRGTDQFNFKKNDDDRWLVAELCIRASDIGHGALSWKQHFEWTGLATTEFYFQGDEESRLGRTLSPLCDRETHSQLAKSQLGFLRHVVQPLFVELDIIDKQKKTLINALENLNNNCNRWEELGKTEELIVFPHSVLDIEATMKGKFHQLDVSMLTREDGLTAAPSRVSTKCKCKCSRLAKIRHQLEIKGSELSELPSSSIEGTPQEDAPPMRIYISKADASEATSAAGATAEAKPAGQTFAVGSPSPVPGLDAADASANVAPHEESDKLNQISQTAAVDAASAAAAAGAESSKPSQRTEAKDLAEPKAPEEHIGKPIQDESLEGGIVVPVPPGMQESRPEPPREPIETSHAVPFKEDPEKPPLSARSVSSIESTGDIPVAAIDKDFFGL